MLGAGLDALGLEDLADVEEGLEVLRLLVLAQQVLADQLVAARVLLVREHDRRLDRELVGRGERPDRPDLGEGLEPVLAHEARRVLLVGAEGLAAVPDAPVVHVAVVRVERVRVAGGARRARPVGAGGIVRRDDLRQHPFEERLVVGPEPLRDGRRAIPSRASRPRSRCCRTRGRSTDGCAGAARSRRPRPCTLSTNASSPGYMLQANMRSCQTSSPSSSATS